MSEKTKMSTNVDSLALGSVSNSRSITITPLCRRQNLCVKEFDKVETEPLHVENMKWIHSRMNILSPSQLWDSYLLCSTKTPHTEVLENGKNTGHGSREEA